MASVAPMPLGRKLDIANAVFLLACASMYLGTGWSLVLFSFPVAPQLTPANYQLQFVPQVTAATSFLTVMTILMIVLGLVMVWREWRTGYRWVPIVMLVGVAAATAFTKMVIFPLNVEMAAGITDPERLKTVLARWMQTNRIRTGIWTVEWLAMTAYFWLIALRK